MRDRSKLSGMFKKVLLKPELLIARVLDEGKPVKVLSYIQGVTLDHLCCYTFCYFVVLREDEEGLIFPKDECKPLSTLIPPAVQE